MFSAKREAEESILDPLDRVQVPGDASTACYFKMSIPTAST